MHCRAQAGSRAPQAPGGAERSGASGRGRARRHPLGASEAGHDRCRYRPRCPFQAAALANARRVWRGLIDRAEREQWSYRDFLTLLATEEIAHRQQTRLARLTRRAHFPFLKTIDDFNYVQRRVM
jgi:hypothetical protein